VSHSAARRCGDATPRPTHLLDRATGTGTSSSRGWSLWRCIADTVQGEGRGKRQRQTRPITGVALQHREVSRRDQGSSRVRNASRRDVSASVTDPVRWTPSQTSPDRACLIAPLITLPLTCVPFCQWHPYLSTTGIFATVSLEHWPVGVIEPLTPSSDSCASSTPQITAPADPPSRPLPRAAHSPTRLHQDRDKCRPLQVGRVRISRRPHPPDRRGSSPPRTLNRCVRFVVELALRSIRVKSAGTEATSCGLTCLVVCRERLIC
jgi:hypothetical protein